MLLTCKEENRPKMLSGTYKGTFIVRNHLGFSQSDAEVIFKGETYNAVEGGKGGSGIYNFIGRDKIRFEDHNAWTADFDLNLVLTGEYEVEIKDDSIILSKEITPKRNPEQTTKSIYQYRLCPNN